MTHRQHVGRIVRKEITIRATPRAVWEAWADPEKIARWFVDRAEGQAEAGQVMTWFFDSFGYAMPVPIVEAEPGKTFVSGGQLPGRLPHLLEVTIEQEGGQTRLRLVNSGFGEGTASDEEVAGIDSGWEGALATLKHWLENHAELRRTDLIVMRPAPFSPDRALPLYVTRDGLRSWLATRIEAPAELQVGQRLRLELASGGTLTGAVLARTRREALLEWQEQRAALGLKAFSGPKGPTLALHVSAWGLEPARRVQLEATLQSLLARLIDRATQMHDPGDAAREAMAWSCSDP